MARRKTGITSQSGSAIAYALRFSHPASANKVAFPTLKLLPNRC